MKYTVQIFTTLMSLLYRHSVSSLLIRSRKLDSIHRAFSQNGSARIIPCDRRYQRSSRCLSSSASSSSDSPAKSFIPPNPPSFTGAAVFPDVEITALDTAIAKQLSMARNMDPEAVFVVTGASRGIGLHLVEALQQRTKGTIIACCRTPETATRLQTLAQHNASHGGAKIEMVPLDLEDPSTMESMINTLTAKYKGRIVALFNVAGILGDGKTTPGPERSITKIQRSWLEKTMCVNFMGPLLLAQAIIPLMRRVSSPLKNTASSSTSSLVNSNVSYPCIIVSVSARVGSIADNNIGGWISYRCSKAALNQATRTMAHEVKRNGILVATFHPGTTDTDLSKPFQGNVADGKLFPVEFTVDRLLAVSECMDTTHTGGFYDWAGKALPF